jgi:hypothetical protein
MHFKNRQVPLPHSLFFQKEKMLEERLRLENIDPG